MLEVSDQETVDQKDFGTAYVSIPVQIGPKVPAAALPRLRRDGRRRRAAARHRHPDPVPRLAAGRHDPRRRRASRPRWEPEPDGVELASRGAGGRTRERAGRRDAPTQLGRAHPHPGPRRRRGLAHPGLRRRPRDAGSRPPRANGDTAQGVGPPRLRPFSVTGLEAGSSQTISLRGYLDSPAGEARLLDRLGGGRLGRERAHASRVRAATSPSPPPARRAARATVDVAVVRRPGPQCAGRGTVDMLGKPGAPATSVAVGRPGQRRQARVRWLPPTYDGGSPVTAYTVDSGVARRPMSRRCTASPCTITGLQDGQDYTFTGRARRTASARARSAPSNPVQPRHPAPPGHRGADGRPRRRLA